MSPSRHADPERDAAAPALVTGAAGFIGRHLTRRLAETDRDVLAVDVAPRPDELAHPRVKYARVDIRDTARLHPLLSEVATVFHLASVHLEVRADEARFREVNVEAAADLVSASAAAPVRRFVHCGSVGIYGHVESPPASEEAPRRPTTPYERTKLEGERAVRDRASETGLPLITLRPTWVYGPGCPRTAKLLRTLRRGRFFYIGDGSNLRHPLFVEEMVDAFLLAEGAPEELAGRAFIIGGPRAMPLRELVETCARVLEVSAPRLRVPTAVGWSLGLAAEAAFGLVGREPPFSRRSLAFFRHDNAFDTTAARDELGFRPRIDFEEGLRRTLGLSSRPVAA